MKKRLFRFTYVPGTTMNEHITQFNQLVADLLNLDVAFEDEDLALDNAEKWVAFENFRNGLESPTKSIKSGFFNLQNEET